jgi:hypothetical protein
MRIPIWFSLIHASFVSNTNIVNIDASHTLFDLELENFSQFFIFFLWFFIVLI